MTTKLILPLILIIALIITPIAGCVVNQAPTASFSYTPSAPTTADSVAFTDASSDGDGSIITWDWNFGDGNTSTSQNPTHTFAAAGSYTVTLTVTDDGGATDTYSETMTVAAAPPGITKWDAIEILVKEIIPPAAAEDRISAFMLSEPLVSGDVVSSELKTLRNLVFTIYYLILFFHIQYSIVHNKSPLLYSLIPSFLCVFVVYFFIFFLYLW